MDLKPDHVLLTLQAGEVVSDEDYGDFMSDLQSKADEEVITTLA